MINLINHSNEIVFIPHKLTVTVIWYILGEKQAQRRMKREKAREYYLHYKRKGFSTVHA